jgi:hypothetical protein
VWHHALHTTAGTTAHRPGGYDPDEVEAGLLSPNTNPLFKVKEDTPSWYAGAMPRLQCEAAVIRAPHGSFLVRDSLAKSKFVLCINDTGGITNFQICVQDLYRGGYSFAGGTYQSMEDIIQLLHKTPVQSKTGGLLRITEPAPVLEGGVNTEGALMEC